ncbi:hypothetical protein [Lactobacillus iners]|uniref:hypothetical protein n=1 Tax=Lactobacillus iners TaxID=147802 RepID=UPI004032F59B
MEKFEGEDFMFQLTANEFENLRCKNFTSSWGWLKVPTKCLYRTRYLHDYDGIKR